jgi:cell division protein FtsW
MPDLQTSTQPSPAAALAGMVACVVALAAMGVVAGVSAAKPGSGWESLSLHAIHLLVALLAFLAAYAIPPERMRKVAPGLLVLLFALLTAMLFTHMGHSSHNAERWIQIGSFSFQPSVLLQCMWPVAMASWVARDPLRLMQPWQLARLMGAFGLLVLPVLFQPDLGSVLILLGVTGITLFFAGVSLRFLRILVPITVSVLVAASFLFNHVSARLTSFWNQEPNFQVARAIEAFAVGGISGRGPGQGRLKLGWVPEGDTDFIFALIAEEWGLFGTGLLWFLFVLFTILGVLAARRAERRYGAILTATAVVMISIQAALNMAVVTGIAPPKGLPLPFVSRGGTSVVALAALLGLTVRACLDKRPSRVPAENLIPWTESNAVG